MQRLLILVLGLGIFSQLAASASTGAGTEPKDSNGGAQVQAPSPDLPGNLLVNLGSSYLLNAPEGMELKIFGSRTLDLYYTYSFDIPNLNLSFVPGLGFGFDRFSFKKAVQLEYNTAGDLVLDTLTNVDAERSKFITNYIDLPIELRYYINIDNKEKSIWLAVGGLVGYNFEAHTKFKYTENDELKMIKRREDWNLNKIRYSAHARIGVGGFSVFYKMGLNELFESGKGPNGFAPTVNTVGISINAF